MKKTLLMVSVLCGLSAIAYAAPYWQVYCVSEGEAINGSASRDEAMKMSNKHVMEYGHTVQVRPLDN